MNKVSYFRKRVMEQYAHHELVDAVHAGEALIREHFNNQTMQGMAYADDLFNLARIYDEIGYAERAVDLYVESARLAVTETGESLPFARRLNNLAALLSHMGRGDAAFHLFTHMTDIMRQSLDAKSPELADAVYNLANSAADAGKHAKAVRLHNEALTIRETVGKPEDVMHSLHSLAVIYEDKKDRARAVNYAERAMKLAEGTDAYAGACYYLAGLYDEDGQHQQAALLFAKTLRHIVQTAGRSHSGYVTVATRFANTLTSLEQYRRALSLQRSVCGILQHKTGGNHIFYANCLRSMAILHKRLNEPGEAAAQMLKSIKIRMRVMGDNARELLSDAVFMTDLYLTEDRLDKALEMMVFILMRTGGNHPGYKQLLNELTEVYLRSGRVRFHTVAEEIEKLYDHERLQSIIRYWTEWEALED